MKKTLILLFLFSVLSPLSAVSGWIGLSSGIRNDWNFESDSNVRWFWLSAEGATYFGASGGFGLSYSAGLRDVVNTDTGSGKVFSRDLRPELILSLAAACRHAFNDTTGLAASLGLSSAFSPDGGRDITLSVFGRAGVDFALSHFGFGAGLELGLPVYEGSQASAADLYMAPYVFAAYRY